MGVLLFIIAYILFLPLSVTNFILVAFKGGAKGYFMSSAISLDKYANRELRTLWNATLKLESGYAFGNVNETISSVLGKNQRDNTLSRVGRWLAAFLDFLDKDHCLKSINLNV